MKVTSQIEDDQRAVLEASSDPFLPLLDRPATGNVGAVGAVVIGELLGIGDDGRTPLVSFPGQPGTAAVAARSVVDLHAVHVGRQVVLMFEIGPSAMYQE